MNQSKRSGVILDERRAVFDPVTTVQVANTAVDRELGSMNVPAYDTIQTAAARFAGDRLLEAVNVLPSSVQ